MLRYQGRSLKERRRAESFEPWEERGSDIETFLVAMRLRETPVPIPNTMVKTQTADGTLLETARESRWLPEYKKVQRSLKEEQALS